MASEVFEQLKALGNDLVDVTVFWFTTPEQRKQVGDLIVQATEALVADEQQSIYSHAWYRETWEELQAERSGITIDAGSLSMPLTLASKIMPPISRQQGDAFFLANTRDVYAATATAFGILVACDSMDNRQRLVGGRLWQRMHLWGTANGLAMQPLNQPPNARHELQLGVEPRFGNALAELLGDLSWHAWTPLPPGLPHRRGAFDTAAQCRGRADIVGPKKKLKGSGEIDVGFLSRRMWYTYLYRLASAE